jgi:hypothetical protein
LIHFIGKDNIVFHCIIFPAMLHLRGDGYVLPEQVPANEFLNLEGQKISTSRNWAVWLNEYLEELPNKKDELRYVLTSIAPETKDSEFTWKDFQTRVNSELVGILGNFANRVLVLMHKYYEGKVPTITQKNPGFSLANLVEKRGATIYEHTAATKIESGKVTTGNGVINARYIVRATEGYTKTLEGQKRKIVPIYSLMMATEPLSPAIWDQIGLARRETFGDFRNLIIYGQRTADDRFAFGGRGAPYHFGSSIKDEYDQHSKVHPSLLGVLAELFPAVANAKVTHTWGGPLGVARDWMASAGLDRKTGIAWAGGYVGDGVGTTNLAGRTLADLITNQETAVTKLPWVNHKSPNWEVEPLRWIGANAGLQIMSRADHAEDKTGKPSKLAGIVSKLLGQ